MHAREKLVQHKRLQQIVVGSEEQPGHAIKGLLAFPRDEDDADRVPLIVTEAAAELIARNVGEVDVQEDHVGGLALYLVERSSRIGGTAWAGAMVSECTRY